MYGWGWPIIAHAPLAITSSALVFATLSASASDLMLRALKTSNEASEHIPTRPNRALLLVLPILLKKSAVLAADAREEEPNGAFCVAINMNKT